MNARIDAISADMNTMFERIDYQLECLRRAKSRLLEINTELKEEFHQTLRVFERADDAISFRARTGCGGWVWAPEDQLSPAILFPYRMTRTEILLHPMTRGLSGRLIL